VRARLLSCILLGTALVGPMSCSRLSPAPRGRTATERDRAAAGSRSPSERADAAGGAVVPGETQAPGRSAEFTQRPREERLTVPAGTALAFRLDVPVSSASAAAGEVVRGELAAPLAAAGSTVAGIGTPVEARVESVVPSGRLARPARLSLALTAIVLGGERVPIVTSPVSRYGRSHTRRNERFIGGGALIGALAGQLIGGHTHSTVNGAAVGAAVGTGAAAATGRLDVAFGAGSVLRFTLVEPLTVQAAR
jgi:hypothetical protein